MCMYSDGPLGVDGFKKITLGVPADYKTLSNSCQSMQIGLKEFGREKKNFLNRTLRSINC